MPWQRPGLIYFWACHSAGLLCFSLEVVMARAVWRGNLSCGLISIPIRVFSAVRAENLQLRQLHADCERKVRQTWVCEGCGETVERTAIVKAYECADGSLVVLTPEELEQCKPEASDTLDLAHFVKLSEVDPIYLAASYFLAPDGEAAEQGYHLMARALRQSVGGLGRWVYRQREHAVLLRAIDSGLVLQTLYRNGEVRAVLADLVPPELKRSELSLMRRMIQANLGSWKPAEFRDGYRAALEELVESKRSGSPAPASKSRSKQRPASGLAAAMREMLA